MLHQRFWQDAELVSPLREALSLFIGEDLITGKNHIIIEGVSDYFYLIGCLDTSRTIKQRQKGCKGFWGLANTQKLDKKSPSW